MHNCVHEQKYVLLVAVAYTMPLQRRSAVEASFALCLRTKTHSSLRLYALNMHAAASVSILSTAEPTAGRDQLTYI